MSRSPARREDPATVSSQREDPVAGIISLVLSLGAAVAVGSGFSLLSDGDLLTGGVVLVMGVLFVVLARPWYQQSKSALDITRDRVRRRGPYGWDVPLRAVRRVDIRRFEGRRRPIVYLVLTVDHRTDIPVRGHLSRIFRRFRPPLGPHDLVCPIPDGDRGVIAAIRARMPR